MEHKFEALTTVLNRCSAKVADQVIAEIRSADDHHFLNNFIYLARLEDLTDNAEHPPLKPPHFSSTTLLRLPRAERSRLQRLAHKTKLNSFNHQMRHK